MSILLGIGTFVLILVSVFLVLVVLAQKAKSDGGMGAAMGAGMTEATFGAETGNVLSKATINAAIAFFVLSFLLYLGRIYQHSHSVSMTGALPTISAPAKPTAVPMTPTPVPSPASSPSAKP
jgi:preprotein translocase subunit SecG